MMTTVVNPLSSILYVISGGRWGSWPMIVEHDGGSEYAWDYGTPGACKMCGKSDGSCVIRMRARTCPRCGTRGNHLPCLICGEEYFE